MDGQKLRGEVGSQILDDPSLDMITSRKILTTLALVVGLAGAAGCAASSGDAVRGPADSEVTSTSTSTIESTSTTSVVGDTTATADSEAGAPGTTPNTGGSSTASRPAVGSNGSGDGPAPVPAPAPVATARSGSGVAINCPNGTVPVIDHAPSSAEIAQLCGLNTGGSGSVVETHTTIPAPTTTTTVPLPKLTSASFTLNGRDLSGLWTTCPTGTVVWTARYDNGANYTGTVFLPERAPFSWNYSPNPAWNGGLHIFSPGDCLVTSGAGWN